MNDTTSTPYISPAKSVDWITPPEEVTDVILPILGEVDIDPASHSNAFVPAKEKYFGASPEDDGWLKTWSTKRVFVNPPWGERWNKEWGPQPETFHPVSMWVAKMIGEAGSTLTPPATVLALLPAYTDRGWFHRHVARSTAFCLLEKRIKFFTPEGKRGGNPGQGQMYVLWTQRNRPFQRFLDVLDARGLIVTPGR